MPEPVVLALVVVAAFLAGAGVAWLVARARLAAVEARREAEGRAAADKLALVEEARGRLTETFQALSAQALASNNESFLQLARAQLERLHEAAKGELTARQQAIGELLAPVREALGKVETQIAQVEKERAQAQGNLARHLADLAEGQTRLSGETAQLARALRTPAVRGRWGEIQLQRVVEIAGLAEHCDFDRQKTLVTDTGSRRPDLIVRLPAGRTIAIDAKAPLQAYLEAIEATDEPTRQAHFAEHARQIARHLATLAARNYWEALDGTPELVVLFLPGEHFFSAALEQQPDLIERAGERRVVIATPTTLIALLKSVAFGWRQERMADNARKVSELGRDLHERLRVFADHLAKVGKSLQRSVIAYNAAVGSLEARVMPGARRFQELGAAGGDELPELTPIDRQTRGGGEETATLDPAADLDDEDDGEPELFDDDLDEAPPAAAAR